MLSDCLTIPKRERAPGAVPDCGKQYSDKFSDALTYIVTTTEKLIDLE